MCVCLRDCMHVCECARLYGECVVFARVSDNICMVIVCVSLGVRMFVNVCVCIGIVLCLYVSLVMFV